MNDDGWTFFAGCVVGLIFGVLIVMTSRETTIRDHPEWATCIMEDGIWENDQCYKHSKTTRR